MSGYVRIHRSLCGHPAFRNDAEAMAFAWLVARAAWKPARVRYKERAINLNRGQVAVSVRDFAVAMDRDKAWIERLLKRLRAETMIEVRHETGVNVITICNYATFQDARDRGKAPVETPGETDARQGRDTEQGIEEGKKELSPARGGKTLLPQDWELPSVSSLPPKARACAEQWTRASYETEGEAFALYWRSAGRIMKDWTATWANRVIAQHSKVLRDQKFGNAPVEKLDPVRRDAAWHEDQAKFFERIGKPDDAAEHRRKAMSIGELTAQALGRAA